jgi:hypothetical protein
MAKVLVLELPDDADLAAAIRAVEGALGVLPQGSRVFGAISPDADRVLAVFGAADG